MRNYVEMIKEKSDRSDVLLAVQKEKLKLLMTLWVVGKAQWQ